MDVGNPAIQLGNPTLLLGHKSRCFASEFAGHCDDLLATASEDGTVRVWETSTRKCCHVLRHSRDNEARPVTHL